MVTIWSKFELEALTGGVVNVATTGQRMKTKRIGVHFSRGLKKWKTVIDSARFLLADCLRYLVG